MKELIKKYDDNDNLVYFKDSKGFECWSEYDSKGNKIHYKNSNGVEEWYEYDENCNMIHYKDSEGYEELYDEKGNKIHSKDSSGKFELFMGCLGNGITCCNKSIKEYGDYKKIAHISSRGNVKFYVSEGYIPQDALNTIRENARLEREKFFEYWHSLSQIKQYEVLLDELPYSVIKDYLRDRGMSLSEKVADLTAYYMTQH